MKTDEEEIKIIEEDIKNDVKEMSPSEICNYILYNSDFGDITFEEDLLSVLGRLDEKEFDIIYNSDYLDKKLDERRNEIIERQIQRIKLWRK